MTEQTMNVYEAKQARKKARLEALAQSVQAASNSTHDRARRLASVIPFGQPILVGHHSEGRDRNYRSKIHNTFGKSFALAERAEQIAQRAASVGKGGISSDDPDAIEKLRAELASLEASQARMKDANKVIRTKKTPEAQVAGLVALGFSTAQAEKLLTKDFAGRIGFASYSLTNNNANISRIKKRIDELAARRERANVEQETEGFTYREDTEENRVMFLFAGKPDEPTRTLLKSHGFKWSPSREGQPWVRQLTNAGIWAGKQVCEALKKAAESNAAT